MAKFPGFYQPNQQEGIACFGCSVANAILLLRDTETAELAYEKSKDHHMSEESRGKKGAFEATTCGIAFRDLTDSRYHGVLHLQSTEGTNIESVMNNSKTNKEWYKTLLREEKEGLLKIISPGNTQIGNPSILIGYLAERPEVQHYMVHHNLNGLNFIVSNGEISSTELLRRFNLIGFLGDFKRVK